MGVISRMTLVLIFLFFVSFLTNAQEQVHGKIVAFDTYPLAKAEITIRKTKKTVLSNFLGEFTIECRKNDKLLVKANGFKSKLIKVKKITDSVYVNLLFGGTQIDLENAIESGHMERDKMVLAVAKSSADKFNPTAYADVLQMILIKFPTIRLVYGELQIRGKATMNGNSNVLIFVNGVASSLVTISNMSVEEISDIKVLTGASTTLYGGGANGVLLITTKIE